MLFNSNLNEIVFGRHEIFEADELLILSGYVGPSPIEKLKEVPLKSTVIYGMYGDKGIQRKLHDSLLSHQENITNVDIFYSNAAIHSKCYIWKNNSKIVHALVGSANFSRNGLYTPYREILAETTRDTFNPLDSYFNKVLKNSKLCTEIELAPIIDLGTEETEKEISEEFCVMSLLGKGKKLYTASGINWGHGDGHVTPNDAYIAIKKDHIKKYPSLFPPKQDFSIIQLGKKSKRHNDSIEIIWDDGTIMDGLLEGNQKHEGKNYPKQISSFPKKSILGEYLRKRIGVSSGKLVKIEDLNSYGKTEIKISLLEEGVYYFDFSNN